jgi:[ribosomal protein S5]-alanine N-acetyltransferase
MPRPPIAHPILATPRLRLRQFRLDDIDAMHACFGHAVAMRFWHHPAHTRRTQTEQVVRRCITSIPSKGRAWAVADAGNDLCLGMVDYHNANVRHRSADIGYIIHPSHHRRGIATEAVGALLDFCFATLGLHRLTAFIEPDNTASRTLVERLGFRREGLLRETIFLEGAWRSHLVYALLETERDQC